MPKGKKINIGRKTRKAKQVINVTNNETTLNRQKRRKSARLRQQERRENECRNEQGTRLELDKEAHRSFRKRITNSIVLENRLKTNRLAHEKLRASESINDRKIRLNLNRVRMNTSRQSFWIELKLEAFNYRKDHNYK